MLIILIVQVILFGYFCIFRFLIALIRNVSNKILFFLNNYILAMDQTVYISIILNDIFGNFNL